MSINSREEANKYYRTINLLVDDYIERWKIRPSNLKRYLQPGSERFNRFLERNKLKDISGAERVLSDIIDDRENMEKDGVITFESFKIFESDEFKLKSLSECLYKGIEKATKDHEKILADYYDTSLGHINILDSNTHSFSVENWKGEIGVIILSEEEVELIKENVKEFLFNEISKEYVVLSKVMEIKILDIMDKNKFMNKIEEILSASDNERLIKMITKTFGVMEYVVNYEGYLIWESTNNDPDF